MTTMRYKPPSRRRETRYAIQKEGRPPRQATAPTTTLPHPTFAPTHLRPMLYDAPCFHINTIM